MPLILKIILIGIGLVGILFVLDKLFLKMEARGWIYYRKKQPSRTTLGNAFLEIQSMIEPGKRQIIETQEGNQGSAGIRRRSRCGGRKRKGRSRIKITGGIFYGPADS